MSTEGLNLFLSDAKNNLNNLNFFFWLIDLH